MAGAAHDEPATDLDALPARAARAALSPLFEAAPQFLTRLAAARPFGTWPRAFEAAREIAHAMPEAEQVELVNAHPRLGARPDGISAHSRREQGTAAADVVSTLARLNDIYEARFGFRYCVFVAGRRLAALVPELEAALALDRDAELHRALDAVVDIARARHEARR